MTGVLGWSPRDWLPLTLRQLVQAYDGRLVEGWDRNSLVACLVSNLTSVVNNLASKGAKSKPKTIYDFHPYRDRPAGGRGLKINAENFGVLKTIANAFAKRKS